MATLVENLTKFKDFKSNPPKTGLLTSSLSAIKKKIVILVPTSNSPLLRWELTVLSLQLIWSSASPGSVITAAFFTLLTLFAEQPAQMLRTVGNDPDLEVQFVEVGVTQSGRIKFASRGADLTSQEDRYMEIAVQGPTDTDGNNPFSKIDIRSWVVKTTEEFQIAIMTVTLQVWILLTKAVTAPDTARDSENRRWIKYLQQKRAHADYQLKSRWLEIARNRMAEDISVRRLMVEILIEVNKMSGAKGRIIEVIADIGNYIAETGMAGFHLTIKYGIETRYPALALNEFQSDLSTILQLMKLYQEQGDRAPYLVILEDAVQTKFSPGNYPLLWSYAMGVGTAIDKAMGHLNYDRPYFEAPFFKLGQDVVNQLEGNVDTRMAAELGLSDQQITELKDLTKGNVADRTARTGRGRTSRFAPERADLEEPGDYIGESRGNDQAGRDLNDNDPIIQWPSLGGSPVTPESNNPRISREQLRPSAELVAGFKESANKIKQKMNQFQSDFPIHGQTAASFANSGAAGSDMEAVYGTV
ncbi:nucleocapsid protein [Piparella virus]|nr:nucleocapsid protein [Piparella virus]